MKMSFPNHFMILLLLSSLLPAQLSSSFGFRISSIQETTSFASGVSSTVEEELAGSRRLLNVSTNLQVTMKEEAAVPDKYLYAADAALLSSSNCQNAFHFTSLTGAIPQDFKALLFQPTVSLTNTVNFLNLIFQASELRETSIREDIEWYHALIQSMFIGERAALVRNALLSFYADPTELQPQLMLWASKGSSQNIYLQDLTLAWDKLHLLPHGINQTWFSLLKSNNQFLSSLSKQNLLHDLSTLDTPKCANGGTYVSNSSGLHWGEAPFLECKEGSYLPGWLLTLFMPFHGLKPDLSPEFRGVIRVDVNIQDFDVNQCATGDFWFADTHQCNRTSMECEPIPRRGFRLGQYCCRCKEGYYSMPAVTADQFDKGSSSTTGCYPEIPVCVPCWPGCKRCQDGSQCWVQENWQLRAVLLAVNGFFMALVIISMLKVYQCRRARPIQASGLLLLEIVLFGSLLLYFPVLIVYFKPSTFRCILLRWVRMLGFAIVYGTVTLKMYRALNVFLSCTALRGPYMTSTSVLRMLGVMVLTVKWFLCSWTVGVLQNHDRNIPLLITLTTSDGQSFRVCDLDRWDYMMAMELLFLCWGSNLGSAVRSVPFAFHEPRYMGIAIHNELLFSTVFHLLRFIKPSLHPDWMLLLFFIHIHVTISVTLGLLFFPKFLHISQLGKEDIASEMHEDDVDLRHSCLHLNNSFTSTCWTDHNLDPDDIRGELKKLYAQLEVHKTKKMENRNPHLQKKRSSYLLLGRSLIRRITEITESMSRQGSRKDQDTLGAEEGQKGSGCCLATSESTRVLMRNETEKLPSTEIQQCVLVKDTSLRNPSVKSRTNKRTSVMEPIDTAPLFSKSASAQNLSIDNIFFQPVSTRIQKSFSFTEKHRDYYPLALDKSFVDTSVVFKRNPKYKADVKVEQSTDSNISNQKQVSEQEILTEKPTSPPALLYVCPWEFTSYFPSSSPPVIKSDRDLNSDVESSRPKPPISSSAPGSPYSFRKPVARCGFSFHSATRTILLSRGLVDKKENGKHSGKKLSKQDGALQQTRSATLSSGVKSIKKTRQTPIRSMACVESNPCLVKAAVIREPSERNSKSNVPSHAFQWKSEDMEYKNIVQSKNIGKPSLSPVASIESTKPSWHQAYLTVPRSAMCPSDVPNRTCRQSNIAAIRPCDVKKKVQLELQLEGFPDDDDLSWEADSKQMQTRTRENQSMCSWEYLGKASRMNSKGAEQHPGQTQAEVVTFNVKQDSDKLVFETKKTTEKVMYVNANSDMKKQVRQELLRSDVCPWETCGTRTNQEKMCVDVYPWKLDDVLGKYSEMIRSTDSKGLTTASTKHLLTKQPTSTMAMDICPWDFPEGFSSQWNSEKLLKRDDVKTLKTIHNPHPPTKHLSPVVKDDASLDTKQEVEDGLPSQISTTIKTESSSQEAKASLRSEGITITKEEETSFQQKESMHDKICIWDGTRQANEDPLKSQQKQITPLVKVAPLYTGEPERQVQKKLPAYADICPWETDQSPRQAQSQAHACPWELDVSGTSTIHASFHVDVSTRESDDKMKEDNITHTAQGVRATQPLTRCDALFPCEMKEGAQASSIKHDNNSDTFTWAEPKAEEEIDAETAAEAFIFPPDLNTSR